MLLPAGSRAVVVVTNFGLLFSSRPNPGLDLVCDDNYGFAGDKVRMDGRGRMFAASNVGLFASDDGCAWRQTGVDLVDQVVWDVAPDARIDGRVWALASEPPVLFLSSDGGRTFVRKGTFSDAQDFRRIWVAPSDSQRVYLLNGPGNGSSVASWLAKSSDGGETWAMRDANQSISPPPENALEFVAGSPDRPDTLFFSSIDLSGDNLWQTTDGGSTFTHLLKLQDGDALIGFTLGSSPQELFVAGRDPYLTPGQPEARLYVSHDGGKSWDQPLVTGPKGPRFRCLGYRDGSLYACGVGEAIADEGLVAVSTDQGKSWEFPVKYDQFSGVRSCVNTSCATTEAWLCDAYQICASAPPPPVDAGVVPPPVDGGPRADVSMATTAKAASGDGGCSCRFAGATDAAPSGGALALLLLGAATVLFQRRDRWTSRGPEDTDRRINQSPE